MKYYILIGLLVFSFSSIFSVAIATTQKKEILVFVNTTKTKAVGTRLIEISDSFSKKRSKMEICWKRGEKKARVLIPSRGKHILIELVYGEEDIITVGELVSLSSYKCFRNLKEGEIFNPKDTVAINILWKELVVVEGNSVAFYLLE